MHHVEPAEPRRLFAGGLDPTFGTAGRVPVSNDDYYVEGVFATHGAVYVDAQDRRADRRVILKYTDAGKLDTAWGDGGVIAPDVFPDPDSVGAGVYPATLAYDARTGGLLIGFGEGSVVRVERRTAGGALDTAWGGGRVEFSERKARLELSALVPRANKKVLIAVDRQQQRGEPTANGRPRPGGRDDVALLRFDRLGRRDRAFNGGRPVTVADGFYVSKVKETDSSYDETARFSDPTFGDLRARPDGSVRVVVTRLAARTTGQSNYGNDSTYLVSRFANSAESVVVADDGVVRTGLTRTYPIVRGTSSGYNGTPTSPFEPFAVAALGEDGLAVLANGGSGGVVVRLSSTARPPAERVELPKNDRFVLKIARGPGGQVLVESRGNGEPQNYEIVRLNADLSPDRTFAGRGIFSDVGLFPFLNFTADDNGRLVVAGDGELSRYA